MAETEPMLQLTTDSNFLDSSSLQLYFNITYKELIRKFGVSPSGAQILLGYEEFQPEINVPFVTPIDLFNDESRVLEKFSLRFRWLGIDSDFHQQLVSRLIGEVKERTSCVSMEDSNVLPFKVQVIAYSDISDDEPDCVEFVPSPQHENRAHEEYDLEESGFIEIQPSQDFGSIENYESNWLDSVEVESSSSEVEDSDYEEDELAYVMRQSSVEYEDGNYGMLPAAVESVEMLEEVKVEEEEKGKTCSVCLEEFDKIALALPCAHIFHEKCIVRWLSTSHFCPLCRSKMPT